MTIEPVAAAQPPAIAGLVLRPFAGPADFPRLAAALNASLKADGADRYISDDEMVRSHAHLPNCDLDRDLLVAEVDGQVVGFARVWWQPEDQGPILYQITRPLRPEWRGQGLGRALLDWAEARLREIAASHAARGEPAGQRLFQLEVAEAETGLTRRLLERGYAPVRWAFDMVRPLSAPVAVSPLPPGLEVRPALPQHYRLIWEAANEAFRDHWGYIEMTEEEYQGWVNGADFQPHLWQIGWDAASGQVAGMVLNFVIEAENQALGRRRGYTEGISVRRAWRRRGLARALLTRSLQMFAGLGMDEAALGVDSENLSGARNLYESAGFQMARRVGLYRKAVQ